MAAVTKYLAWLVTAAAVIGAALLLIAGLGTRFEVWDYKLGLMLFSFGLYAVLGAIGGAVLWGLLRIFSGSTGYGRRVALSALLAIVAAAFPLYQISIATSVPPIHDITTDLEDPPKFIAVLPLRTAKPDNNPPDYQSGQEVKACLTHGPQKLPDCQKATYPDIQPIMSPKPPAEVFASALHVADEMGWEVVDKNPIEGRIEATATTLFFGFKDDIVIRIRPEGTGSRLDIRSKSRVGVSDVGANAARIRAFRDKLGT
jgi:uncharacterized protein (DUF1499 family)